MTAVHPPVRCAPLIRVLPTPRTEPPYEDECDAPPALPGQLSLPWVPAAPLSGTDGPAVAIPTTGAPALGAVGIGAGGAGAAGTAVRGARTVGAGTVGAGAAAETARPGVRGAAAGTAGAGAGTVGVEVSRVQGAAGGEAGAAEERLAAWRFAARYAEILDGRRPVAHLGPVAVPAALSPLMADALHARAHLRDLAAARRPGGGRAGRHPAGRPATITVGRPLVSCPRAGVLDAVVVLRLRAGVARSLAFRLLYDAGTWRATEAALVGATAPPDATAHP